MPISAYSTDRDTNAGIVPGNIRVRDPELQQLVNSNRQLMADLAALGITPFIEGLLNDIDALAARTTLGLIWESIGPLIDINNVASVIWTNLSAYRRIRISGKIIPVTNNTAIVGHASNDNGASWLNGASEYSQSYIYNNGATPSAGAANSANISLGVSASSSAYGVKFNTEIDEWNKAVRGHGITASHTISSGGADFTALIAFIANTTTARNAFRITSTSGNLSSGFVTLEGIRG